MSDTTANWEHRQYARPERETTSSANARAERILARAERRDGSMTSEVLEPATIDRMDKVAFVVAAIMTIGPLFAAYVGSLMIS